MTDNPNRTEQLIASLRHSDYRMTPQRMALLRLIAESTDHPSATQLYGRVKIQFPTMSLATVYKTLALLKDMGQVLEIDLRDDSHYDGNRPQPHPHLICIKCNKIMDGEADFDPSTIRQLEQASGYKILRAQVSFYGLCPDCKKEGA
jgi:Fur family transcriptional regulator, peroxide stress response regulator